MQHSPLALLVALMLSASLPGASSFVIPNRFTTTNKASWHPTSPTTRTVLAETVVAAAADTTTETTTKSRTQRIMEKTRQDGQYVQ
jgi:hypothetical protein